MSSRDLATPQVSFRTKEESKLGVLEQILQPGLYPDLYGEIYHKVRTNYYPPRGDSKEGWDNLDIFGWLGYPMQMKIDFLCRDSILAAPLVLDLILLTDLAQRAGLRGIQEWLTVPNHATVHPNMSVSAFFNSILQGAAAASTLALSSIKPSYVSPGKSRIQP